MVSCPLLPLSVGTDPPPPGGGIPSAVGYGHYCLRRQDEVSRQLKKRLYSGRGLWYADNKCLQDFVGTDDRSAGLHHILSHYVEKRQMNVRSVFAALYTA